MNFAGQGTVQAGEYNEKINIAGSGYIKGNIKCEGLESAGSTKSDGDIECTGEIETAGAFSVRGSVKAGGKIETSGTAKIDGSLKCDRLECSGVLHTGEGIEAEEAELSGVIDCVGLLNAEKVNIKFGGRCHAGSIGGGEIKIRCGDKVTVNHVHDLPLFSKLIGKKDGAGFFTVDEYIEGDTIAVECVSSPVVTGRIVAIGAGCEIGTVRYSEQCEVSPDAKVGNTEKI